MYCICMRMSFSLFVVRISSGNGTKRYQTLSDYEWGTWECPLWVMNTCPTVLMALYSSLLYSSFWLNAISNYNSLCLMVDRTGKLAHSHFFPEDHDNCGHRVTCLHTLCTRFQLQRACQKINANCEHIPHVRTFQ